MGRWVMTQRTRRRNGSLSASRHKALDELRGWEWECNVGSSRALVPVEEEEQDAVDWRALARLARAMPSAAHRGTAKHAARWDATLRALRAFVGENSRYPTEANRRHDNRTHDTEEGWLAKWATMCRHWRREGSMPTSAVRRLEALPGWELDLRKKPGPRVVLGDQRAESGAGGGGVRDDDKFEVQRLLRRRIVHGQRVEFLVRAGARVVGGPAWEGGCVLLCRWSWHATYSVYVTRVRARCRCAGSGTARRRTRGWPRRSYATPRRRRWRRF